jgi:hypothetical protein
MYALAHAADRQLKLVSGRGLFYTLEIEGLKLDELASRISGVFRRNIERLNIGFSRLLREEDLTEAERTLENVELLTKYLEELKEPGHAVREGRAGKGESFKLPLMPTAGKYYRVDLTASKKYQTREYAVCSYCSALATLGLALGSLAVRWRANIASTSAVRQRATHYIVSTIKFDGEVEGNLILNLTDYFLNLSDAGKKFLDASKACLDKMPERLFGYLLLGGLDDRIISAMAMSNASWNVISTRFEVVRVVQVRGYHSIGLDQAIATLADLIKMDEKLKSNFREKLNMLCVALLNVCSVEALERLFEFMSTRNIEKIYEFARTAYTDLTRARVNFSASELIETLAQLCTGI